jgi:O-Antigen ligase
MTSSPVAAPRLRRAVPSAETAQDRERHARRRVCLAWGLLLLNTLTFYPGVSLLHIPSIVGKLIQQGALPAAFLVALTINRRVTLRPNVFLVLVSLLVIEALVTSLDPQHFGTVYRTFRLAGFVATLWLLTPWWGRRDLLLVRCYLALLSAVLGSVLLGLLLSPGRAFYEDRLGGVIWPIPATEVGHYAAVMTGLVAILWLCGHIRGRIALVVMVVAVAMLILTHTRTALVAMLAGIFVAGLSLIVATARARKLFAAAGLAAAVGVLALSSYITTWLARGEGTRQLTDLTGRTTVWSALVAFPRTKFQVLFGFGLSNKSFNGLPIDSNWLASYNDQGLFGVAICAAILLFLLVKAYFQPHGVQRALGLFLVTYCLVASVTEVGFTDVSPYLLELCLAASLLVPTAADRGPP